MKKDIMISESGEVFISKDHWAYKMAISAKKSIAQIKVDSPDKRIKRNTETNDASRQITA